MLFHRGSSDPTRVFVARISSTINIFVPPAGFASLIEFEISLIQTLAVFFCRRRPGRSCGGRCVR